MDTAIILLAAPFCTALVAAWPSRKWFLSDLVMVALVVGTTVTAGYGAGGMYAIQSFVTFIAHFAVGSFEVLTNLRVTKQLSIKALNPLFERINRVGLIALSSIMVIILMVTFKAI